MSDRGVSDREGFPAGSTVVIRDETWLVQRAERVSDGWFLDVVGISELVRGTEATFSSALDDAQLLDPAKAQVVADGSPRHRDARLWLEATLRKSAIPLLDERLTVAKEGLVEPLPYQLDACRKALHGGLRPRILLADAVGLGKTIEIGMILSELVRRGRGERILVVTPRHVLEQMQFELWTRFSLPFVRLDSLGIQRIRQQLPATRNPFTYFKRVIISIDTLKSDRYHAHLERQHWDAVVIDESHNVTNSGTQNNRLARLLSSRTDALILASATPHNGKRDSFAELIRMLEPTAVTPKGELIDDEVRRLVVRRHRHSPEVAGIVGSDWAERLPPKNVLVPANPIENEIAAELDRTWLHPSTDGDLKLGSQLLPWTLAKAFLSSPAALHASVVERTRRSENDAELAALARLQSLAERNLAEGSAKLDALLAELKRIGIKRSSDARVVVFAERVPTLEWLREHVTTAMKLKPEQVALLHGGLSDVEQQEMVEAFKQASSPIRVLVTGDVASEGVNLHLQCHELIHYDIPWSLIRIEQRNGRIDRYGQLHPPQITALLLDLDAANFSGDLRVLRRLIEKEHEAHKALGDSASLMGKYDVEAEEKAIREVLAGRARLDDVVKEVDEVRNGGGIEALLAGLAASSAEADPMGPSPAAADEPSTVYAQAEDFLYDALEVAFVTPEASPDAGGTAWEAHPAHHMVEFAPSRDLAQRLRVLPQSYLRDRRVDERVQLATTVDRGLRALNEARGADSSSLWPAAQYLAPLHPALDWAADRALATLQRNQVYAVAAPPGAEDEGAVLVVLATLANRRGQVVASSHVLVRFPDAANPQFAMPEPVPSVSAALAQLGLSGGGWANRGQINDVARWQPLIAPGVDAVRRLADQQFADASDAVQQRVDRWVERVGAWEAGADELFQRSELRSLRRHVAEERGVAESMLPAERSVRPLLLVVPSEVGW